MRDEFVLRYVDTQTDGERGRTTLDATKQDILKRVSLDQGVQLVDQDVSRREVLGHLKRLEDFIDVRSRDATDVDFLKRPVLSGELITWQAEFPLERREVERLDESSQPGHEEVERLKTLLSVGQERLEPQLICPLVCLHPRDEHHRTLTQTMWPPLQALVGLGLCEVVSLSLEVPRFDRRRAGQVVADVSVVNILKHRQEVVPLESPTCQ